MGHTYVRVEIIKNIIYKMNRSEHKIEFWGTLFLIIFSWDVFPSIETQWTLLSKYERKKLSEWPLTPYRFSFSESLLTLTQSNVFDKSHKFKLECLPFSKASTRVEIIFNIACEVVRLELNPYWNELNVFYRENFLRIISNISENIGMMVIGL